MHLALNATDIGRQRGGNESYLLGLIDGLRSRPATGDRFSLMACRAGLIDLAAAAAPRSVPRDRHRPVSTLGGAARLTAHVAQTIAIAHGTNADLKLLRPLAAPWHISARFKHTQTRRQNS